MENVFVRLHERLKIRLGYRRELTVIWLKAIWLALIMNFKFRLWYAATGQFHDYWDYPVSTRVLGCVSNWKRRRKPYRWGEWIYRPKKR